MVAQPKDGGAVRRRISPDALVDAPAVMQAGRQHVDLCVIPRDELPVHPDRAGRCQLHVCAPEVVATEGIRDGTGVAAAPTSSSRRSMLCDWSARTSR